MTSETIDSHEELLYDMNENAMGILEDIDPDVNLLNELNISECNYYNESTFKAMISDRSGLDNALSMMHLNVRSIQKHFDEVVEYINSINYNFDIIGFSETWHTNSTADLYNIPGYQCMHKYRESRKGGGVTLYLKDKFCYKIRPDLCILGNDVDCLFIDIDATCVKGLTSHIILGLIYRPPNTDLPSFIDNMSQLMSKIRAEKKDCYLMGDYNVNLLNADVHQNTGDFVNCILAFSYFPLITKPTRMGITSATLIDNIFCSNILQVKDTVNGVLCAEISDHFPIFTLVYHSNVKNKEDVLCRPITVKGKKRFKETLARVDWNDILLRYENKDVNLCYNRFVEAVSKIYRDSFPLKKLRQRDLNKPWLTDNLKHCIRVKNKLYMYYKKHPVLHNEIKYKAYRNTLRKCLRQAERQHYDTMFSDCKGNTKKTWSIIKNVIGTCKTANNTNTEFDINDVLVTNGECIANHFNSHFVNIGPTLASKIDKDENNVADHYLKGRNVNSIFVNPVTECEMTDVIKGLRNNSSPGWDGIKTDVIKEVCDIIVKPLTHIINMSLNQGVVPDAIKVARVVPIYKAGDHKQIVNYRPVSVLTCLSKVFERLVYNRLIGFIDRYSIFNEGQFGFRKRHSTEQAVCMLIDKICKSMDKGNNFVGVFLDLSKAFDTVDHVILLSKLEHYGIRGNLLVWITSYLQNRKQFVQYNGHRSNKKDIVCGVPQGSILGPLLFLLYINDLSYISNVLSSIMFADDANMFHQHSDLNVLEESVNEELKKVVKWLQANKLTLNVKKTHVMLFTKKHVKHDLKIYIGEELLNVVCKSTFLGVVIDSKLTFNEHIKRISGKISKGIGILKKVRYKLQTKTLITLYYAFIYPYLMYCNTVWGNTAKVYTNQLIVLQKRCIRIIHNVGYLDSTYLLFKESKIITVPDLYIYNVCIFMFKHWKDLLPTVFNKMFVKRSNISTHLCRTRHSNCYELVYCRTDTHKRSISYTGPFIFNYIINGSLFDVNCINSIHHFKKLLRLNLSNITSWYRS